MTDMSIKENGSVLIKWKSIYYPIGEWVDQGGSKVGINGNFKCKYHGSDLICIMKSTRSGAGHGDPSIDAKVPVFIDADTLDSVIVSGFIEVTIK